MNEQELYVMDLVALCVRKGRKILITGLVFAALLGGWQLYKQIQASRDPEFSEEKIEARYQEAIKKYNNKVASLQKSIADKQSEKASAESYVKDSLKMKVDPTNTYRTYIFLGFSDIGDDALGQIRNSNTSIDYIYSKIRSQYTMVWASLKLPDDIGLSGYDGIKEKYIREVLGLNEIEGGLLRITALGSSKEETELLADSLYKTLVKYAPAVTKNAYGHSLTVLSRSTKNQIEDALASFQQEKRDELEALQTNIDTLQENLENLEEPQREDGFSREEIAKKTVISAVIGAGVGVAAACIFALLWAALSTPLLSSRQLERQTDVTCLGAVRKEPSLFDRWADKLCGERRWKNREQAISYAVRKLETQAVQGTRVLMATTMRNSKRDDAVGDLAEALSERGYRTGYVCDSLHDPAFMDAVKESDGVVLYESQGNSHMEDILDSISVIKTMGKPVLGFVTV